MGVRWGRYSLAHIAPWELASGKRFYSTKKAIIENMARQQSDTLRSKSKCKQSRIVPSYQIFSHTTVTRSNMQG